MSTLLNYLHPTICGRLFCPLQKLWQGLIAELLVHISHISPFYWQEMKKDAWIFGTFASSEPIFLLDVQLCHVSASVVEALHVLYLEQLRWHRLKWENLLQRTDKVFSFSLKSRAQDDSAQVQTPCGIRDPMARRNGNYHVIIDAFACRVVALNGHTGICKLVCHALHQVAVGAKSRWLVCFRVICRMQNVCIAVFSPKKRATKCASQQQVKEREQVQQRKKHAEVEHMLRFETNTDEKSMPVDTADGLWEAMQSTA